jgi:hypothetical protein
MSALAGLNAARRSFTQRDAVTQEVEEDVFQEDFSLPVGLDHTKYYPNILFVTEIVTHKIYIRLLATAFKDGKGEPNIKFLHGTTTLGFVFQGGVIIAVDSRASMGGYVASQTVQKCIPITP